MAMSEIHKYFSSGHDSTTFDAQDLDNYACLGEAATPLVTQGASDQINKIKHLCDLWQGAEESNDEEKASKIFQMLQTLIKG
jgi:hypothetical protein